MHVCLTLLSLSHKNTQTQSEIGVWVWAAAEWSLWFLESSVSLGKRQISPWLKQDHELWERDRDKAGKWEGGLCCPSAVLSVTSLFSSTNRRKPIISHKPWWVLARCCPCALIWDLLLSFSYNGNGFGQDHDLADLRSCKMSLVICCRCQAKQHTWRNVQMESIKHLLLISWEGIYLMIGTLVKLESTVIIVFCGLTACLNACAEILFYEGVICWLDALFKDSHLYIWTLLPLQYFKSA